MQVEGEPVSVVPKDGLDGTAGNAAGSESVAPLFSPRSASDS